MCSIFGWAFRSAREQSNLLQAQCNNATDENPANLSCVKLWIYKYCNYSTQGETY